MYQTYLAQQAQVQALKFNFTQALCQALNLVEVEAPLLTDPKNGTQDTLNGIEQGVQVPISSLNKTFEVVHSLAKWKRTLLSHYNFPIGQGIVTHMKALRAHEDLTSPIHSVFVDQWDWEQVIDEQQPVETQLKHSVARIYQALRLTAEAYQTAFQVELPFELPSEVFFITSEALLQRYPALSAKEREQAIVQEKQVVFLQNIGYPLSHGKPHDNRAPDYDNWLANGDLLVWNPVLHQALELSSMGVRVQAKQLLQQWFAAQRSENEFLPWHQDLLKGQLKATIGGGIGQSRLCMWLMQLPHIGLVQESVWPPAVKKNYGLL